MPGGGQILDNAVGSVGGQAEQVYRYDNVEALVQCISCASPYAPEPREASLFDETGGEGVNATPQGIPQASIASANGDFVFFDTPAALLPADVDGELKPQQNVNEGSTAPTSNNFSTSSDVYEWRRFGVDGCAHAQGCLALITTGGGGRLNILLGTAHEGRDVFFATNEVLTPSDKDTSSDIYDARIDGGFAEPSLPVPCEGDACAPAPAAPNDVTPSSFSFQGLGNPAPAAAAAPVVKKKAVAKKKPKKKSHKKKRGKRSGKQAKRPTKGRK